MIKEFRHFPDLLRNKIIRDEYEIRLLVLTRGMIGLCADYSESHRCGQHSSSIFFKNRISRAMTAGCIK